MKLVYLFPGQSSRYPEMLSRMLELGDAETARRISVASEVVGRDLAAHYRPDQGDSFATNRDIQVGVFLANQLHLDILERAGVRAERSVGLSLGEYNHLVHIGALPFEDALRLVDARGRAYDAGPRGMMASIFPLGIDELEELLGRVRGLGVVEVATKNSPTQNVIAGDPAAVEAACNLADEEHGAQGVVIERQVPMHVSLFAPAAELLRPALLAAPWRRPTLPYMPNVLGAVEPDPSPAKIVEHLLAHVHRPVEFRVSVERLADELPEAAFVEVGPRAVLYNLLRRRWLKNPAFKTDDPKDARAVYQLAKELTVGS